MEVYYYKKKLRCKGITKINILPIFCQNIGATPYVFVFFFTKLKTPQKIGATPYMPRREMPIPLHCN
jgi:hypothetical protein